MRRDPALSVAQTEGVVSGTNGRTWAATCRRSSRRNGERSSSGPTKEPTYQAAKERLTDLHADLEQINRRAASSLREGLEETLTLHRLGLFEELGRSLLAANCIENLNGQVEDYTGNVKRWHHSPQRHRWMALALLEAESRMRRLTGYRDLPKLKQALKEAIPDRE